MNDDITLPGYDPAPAVIAAEMAVLGAAIERKADAETAAAIVAPADFHNPQHQLVAEAVEALVEAGDPVNPVAVLDALTARGARFGAAGAGPFLHTLMQHRSDDVTYDARIVAKDADRRAALQELAQGCTIAGRHTFDPDEDLDRIRQRLDAVASRRTGNRLPTLGEVVLARLDEFEKGQPPDAIAVPYVDLQVCLGGLRPGQLIVLGARPGVGKTVVGVDLARYAAIRNQEPTLYFSLEMSRGALVDRIIAAEAKINLSVLRKQRLSEDEWNRIAKRSTELANAPLTIDDSSGCSLAHIRARLRGMARTAPARLVIVDYLQLMQAPRAESRERQVAELSRGLKLLAMEFNVPIVLSAQLNRESMRRNDKKPALSDLRESGSLEQDADIVILLHREDAHEPESPRAGEIDLIVAKHRAGTTPVITCAWQGHYARVMDMAPALPPTSWGNLPPAPDSF